MNTSNNTTANTLSASVLAARTANAAKTAVSASSITTKPLTTSLAADISLSELGIDKDQLGYFKAYNSQLPPADAEGTRIVKCLYRAAVSGANKGKKAKEDSYTRVPTKHLTEEHIVSRIAELSPFVLSWLQGLEDEIIRDKHKAGSVYVAPSILSFDSLIELLEEKEAGSRLNKEKVEAWFTASLEEFLAVAFAERLGLDETSSEEEYIKLEQVLSAYKAKFASLASPKTFIKEADCEAMIKVITEAEADSTLLGARFIARLKNMNKKTEEVLLSL